MKVPTAWGGRLCGLGHYRVAQAFLINAQKENRFNFSVDMPAEGGYPNNYLNKEDPPYRSHPIEIRGHGTGKAV